MYKAVRCVYDWDSESPNQVFKYGLSAQDMAEVGPKAYDWMRLHARDFHWHRNPEHALAYECALALDIYIQTGQTKTVPIQIKQMAEEVMGGWNSRFDSTAYNGDGSELLDPTSPHYEPPGIEWMDDSYDELVKELCREYLPYKLVKVHPLEDGTDKGLSNTDLDKVGLQIYQYMHRNYWVADNNGVLSTNTLVRICRYNLNVYGPVGRIPAQVYQIACVVRDEWEAHFGDKDSQERLREMISWSHDFAWWPLDEADTFERLVKPRLATEV